MKIARDAKRKEDTRRDSGGRSVKISPGKEGGKDEREAKKQKREYVENGQMVFLVDDRAKFSGVDAASKNAQNRGAQMAVTQGESNDGKQLGADE